MKRTVAYYSRTDNTKVIADAIAKALECDSIPINLMKKGRKSKKEIEEEKQIFKNAIEQCNKSDFVFIGTPTEFRKPHPEIVHLIDNLNIKSVAVFCTYYGMLGATFYDLEALLLKRNISIFNELKLCVGTMEYKFSLDKSQYKEQVTSEHLQSAYNFALKTVTLDKPLPVRLKGVCGVDCQFCNEFNKSCNGAGYNCWSGRQCEIFNCCVITKSYYSCKDCNHQFDCSKLIK